MNNLTGEEVRKLLLGIELFKSVHDHAGMVEFISKIEKQYFRKGRVLFREGTRGNTAYILLNGSVEVKRKSFSGDNFVVAVLNADDEHMKYPFIGESSFFTKSERTATIKTLEDCVVLRLQKNKFDKLSKKYPEIGMQLYRVMCDLLQFRLSIANRNVIAIFETYLGEIMNTEDAEKHWHHAMEQESQEAEWYQ